MEATLADSLHDPVANTADLGQIDDGGSYERTRDSCELHELGKMSGEPRDRVRLGRGDNQEPDEMAAVMDGRVGVGLDTEITEQHSVGMPGAVEPGLNPRPHRRTIPQVPAAPDGQAPQRHRHSVGSQEGQGQGRPVEPEVVQRGGRQARQAHHLAADRFCRGRRRGPGLQVGDGAGDQRALPSLALPPRPRWRVGG